MTVRVVVVDDHPFYRDGVVASLGAFDADIEVVATADSGEAAIDACAVHDPAVVLMDLRMPGIGGLEAIRRIRERAPEIGILVLTMSDDESVFAALQAGARGYLLKQAGVEELSRAIHAVGRGDGIFGPSITTRLQHHFATTGIIDQSVLPALTPRERDILRQLVRGEPVDAIARRLGIAAKTVRNYIANIYAKLLVADRDGAVAAARAAGLT